jgi:hypothetical protein
MSGYVVKDGHNVLTYDMTFRRLFVPITPVPIPFESESLRIAASSENGDVRILVGGADVDIDNGLELTAGGEVTVGGGLGQYIAANTIYVVAVGGTGYIHYMIHN